MAKRTTTKRTTTKRARTPRRPLPEFSFWCASCENWVGLVYRNRPERNGMTGHPYNTRRMVLECDVCGCVHAERKRPARRPPGGGE